MRNNQKIFCLFSILLSSTLLIACDKKEKTVQTEQPASTQTTTEQSGDTPVVAAVATEGNYKATITTSFMGNEQSIVVEKLPLPAGEKEFCQGKDLVENNMPEGSSMTACSFDGKTGKMSFLLKVEGENLETHTTYKFERM